MPTMRKDPTVEAMQAVGLWICEHRPELSPLFDAAVNDRSDPRAANLLRAFVLLGFEAGKEAATQTKERPGVEFGVGVAAVLNDVTVHRRGLDQDCAEIRLVVPRIGAVQAERLIRLHRNPSEYRDERDVFTGKEWIGGAPDVVQQGDSRVIVGGSEPVLLQIRIARRETNGL